MPGWMGDWMNAFEWGSVDQELLVIYLACRFGHLWFLSFLMAQSFRWWRGHECGLVGKTHLGFSHMALVHYFHIVHNCTMARAFWALQTMALFDHDNNAQWACWAVGLQTLYYGTIALWHYCIIARACWAPRTVADWVPAPHHLCKHSTRELCLLCQNSPNGGEKLKTGAQLTETSTKHRTTEVSLSAKDHLE